MRVQQLEQMYKEAIYRLKEQMKKQEKERLEAVKLQAAREQKAVYEKKLQDEKSARGRELRLIQEELERLLEQAAALKTQMDGVLKEREE